MSHARSCVVLCLFAALTAFSSSALAQQNAQAGSEIIKIITPERLAAVLQSAGYRAEIPTTGKPRVRTGLSGYNVTIDLYGCKDTNCISMQFYAGFKKDARFSQKFVNSWNQEKRYAKAYLNKDDELSFEFDVLIEGGVTPEFLKEQVMLYERLLSQLDKFEAK